MCNKCQESLLRNELINYSYKVPKSFVITSQIKRKLPDTFQKSILEEIKNICVFTIYNLKINKCTKKNLKPEIYNLIAQNASKKIRKITKYVE